MSLPAASATEPGTESDVELAVRLAREAGHLLVTLREAMWRDGAHSWDVMDHGDAAAHEFIGRELRLHRPDDAVLELEHLHRERDRLRSP